jgi:hypothetical protein
MIFVLVYPPARAPRTWPAVRWTVSVVALLEVLGTSSGEPIDWRFFLLIAISALSAAVYAYTASGVFTPASLRAPEE